MNRMISDAFAINPWGNIDIHSSIGKFRGNFFFKKMSRNFPFVQSSIVSPWEKTQRLNRDVHARDNWLTIYSFLFFWTGHKWARIRAKRTLFLLPKSEIWEWININKTPSKYLEKYPRGNSLCQRFIIFCQVEIQLYSETLNICDCKFRFSQRFRKCVKLIFSFCTIFILQYNLWEANTFK